MSVEGGPWASCNNCRGPVYGIQPGAASLIFCCQSCREWFQQSANDERAEDTHHPEARPAFLRGRQVMLKGLLPRDLDRHPSAAFWGDDRRVTRYMSRGTWPADPTDYAESKENHVDLGIWCGEDLIGTTGFYRIRWVPRRAGFHILIGDPNYWGKGVGTEATMLMLAYGFEVLNLHKVWLGVADANEGAIRAYEKAGFVREGRLRDEVYRNRTYYDAIRMSVLREEYDGLRDTWPIADVLEEQFPAEGRAA